MESCAMSILTFKKLDGKWQSQISGDFAFLMSQSHGISPEDLGAMVNALPRAKLAALTMREWMAFCVEHPEAKANSDPFTPEFAALLKEGLDRSDEWQPAR